MTDCLLLPHEQPCIYRRTGARVRTLMRLLSRKKAACTCGCIACQRNLHDMCWDDCKG